MTNPPKGHATASTKIAFQYVTSTEAYVNCLSSLPKGLQVALDTETMCRPEYEGKGGTALDPHTGRISLIIILARGYVEPIIFDLLLLEADDYDPQLLVDYLESCEFILGANIKFDAKQLRGTLGYEPLKLADVIIMAKIISNATGSKAGKAVGHSYGDLCREYLNVHLEGKGTLQKSTWATGNTSRTLDNEWWLTKLQYAAADVKYLFPLYDIMYKVITTPLPDTLLTKTGNTDRIWGLGMDKVLKREMEFIPLVVDMEFNGLPVSLPVMGAFQEGVVEELNDTAVYLSKELNLDEPQRDWRGKEVPSLRALKVLRSAQGLLDLVQTALKFKKIDNMQALVLKRMLEILEHFGSGFTDDEAVTSDEVFISEDEASLFQELTMLEESEITRTTPIVKAILDFKRLVKQNAMDLRKYLNPSTGCVHPSYSQIGTATSRLSSSGPNGQQISNKTHILIEGEAVHDLGLCGPADPIRIESTTEF
jgi:hypothetical protein